MHKSDLSSSLNATKYKIVLLGNSGVGKSSIIDRFVKGEIDNENQVRSLVCSRLLGLIF
jgi:GTPase SAR1 family protein